MNYQYMEPFGYLAETDLIGEGQCNNPLYRLAPKEEDKVKLVDSKNLVGTRIFNNHAFSIIDNKVFDACVGPHLGTETVDEYIKKAVDNPKPTASATANPPDSEEYVTKANAAKGSKVVEKPDASNNEPPLTLVLIH
jgi:hypothetical protein